MYKTPRTELGESGLVSMVVATMLIVILSLLVLAFAQISSREQRESLDTQLSTQAFYAAESGVNDARAVLAAAAPNISAKTTCALNESPYNFHGVLNAADNVEYTCVLIDPTPNSLVGKIGFQPTVFHLKSSDTISTVTIKWNKSNTGSISNCPTSVTSNNGKIFSNADDWQCPYGGLRMDLVPTRNLSRDALVQANMTGFLVPVNGPGTASPAYTTGSGSVIGAKNCDTACSVTLDVASAATSELYMRLSALYTEPGSNVSITARTTGGATVNFIGAQARVDVTGKAQDVLRRIVVSVPLFTTNTVPRAALQSGDAVCKRFNVADGVFSLNGSLAGTNNPLCGSDAPDPAPPTPPAAPGNDADASFISGRNNPNPTLPPPAPLPGPFYGRYFTNTSASAVAGAWTSCDWNFGDGSPVLHTACTVGDEVLHNYPQYANNRCTPYTVTLTEHLKNGQNPSYIKKVSEPHGADFPGC